MALFVVVAVAVLVWYLRCPESFVAPRFHGARIACRVHKVFAGDDAFQQLFAVNRRTAEVHPFVRNGETPAESASRNASADYTYSYDEARRVCNRHSRLTGFVLYGDADQTPEKEAVLVSGGVPDRYQAWFFDDAMRASLKDIPSATSQAAKDIAEELEIDNGGTSRQQAAMLLQRCRVFYSQHVFCLYDIDQCHTDSYCPSPALHEEFMESQLKFTRVPTTVPTSTFRTLALAKRHCSAIGAAGFTMLRGGVGTPVFYQSTEGALYGKLFAKGACAMEEIMLDTDRVFYARSETAACRTTVPTSNTRAEYQKWWRDRERNGDQTTQAFLSDEHVTMRVCEDDNDNDCFQNTHETTATERSLGTTFARPKGGGDHDDPYVVYKDVNEKLYVRQRDDGGCCENRIGHYGTIPTGSSPVIRDRVASFCPAGATDQPFFNPKCDRACKDTHVYRRDLGRCVPRKDKCRPNKSVCSDPALGSGFKTECPTNCQDACGMGKVSQDRGYYRMHQHPKNVTDLQGHTAGGVTLGHCQAACDNDPECKAFEVTNCSTESDACMGQCTRFGPKEGEGLDEGLETGTRKVARNARVYAKRARNEETDPHVKGFFRRNNQCSMDGKPVYRYSFLGPPGSDRSEGFANYRTGSDNGILRIPNELEALQRTQAEGVAIHVYRSDDTQLTLIGIVADIRPAEHAVTVGGIERTVSTVFPRSTKHLSFVDDDRKYVMRYISTGATGVAGEDEE